MSDEQQIDATLEFENATEFEVAQPQNPNQSVIDPGGMEQLRGILLGPLSHDLELKLTQLSQRLDGSLIELDKRVAGRVAELESHFKSELESVGKEQVKALKQASKDLESSVEQIDGKLEALAERMAGASEKNRDDWAREIQSVRAELESLSTTIPGQVAAQAAMLRTELVDRESLAVALSEVAMRVSSVADIVTVDPPQEDLDLDAALGEALP